MNKKSPVGTYLSILAITTIPLICGIVICAAIENSIGFATPAVWALVCIIFIAFIAGIALSVIWQTRVKSKTISALLLPSTWLFPVLLIMFFVYVK